jgi:FkbM family methyltransferase
MDSIYRSEYRNGVIIEIAFSSSAKRTMEKELQASDVEPYLFHDKPSHVAENVIIPENKEPKASDVKPYSLHDGTSPATENAIISKNRKVGVTGIIKRFLRPVAKLVFRLLRPAVRPVAFRLRRYLTEDLRQDVLNTHALSLQEIQAARESIRQDILNTHALSLQEIHAARESIRQDILNTHALSLQEMLRSSAGTLQEVQAARESIRQDILNTHALSLQEFRAQAANLFPRLDRIELYSVTTARRFAINCGQDEILVRTEVGYILCAATDHAVLACLIDTGELERGTRLLIQRFLSPGDVFVDVGANLGLHTLAAARAMQGRGKIIAFEPFEPTKRLLEKSVWMDGFSEITEIHQAAVSNKIGHQKLFLGASSGHHSLFPLDTPSGLSAKTVEVPLVRLDGIIHTGQKVNLIKIDVEGAELEVLDSAVSVIKHNPDIALIVEFGPSHLKRTGHSTEQWLSAFTGLGLIYRAINPDTGLLEDWSLDQLENTDSINLFFAHAGSQAWMKMEKTA